MLSSTWFPAHVNVIMVGNFPNRVAIKKVLGDIVETEAAKLITIDGKMGMILAIRIAKNPFFSNR